jgi:dTDP-4-amino-4,6-dideoxygalactose transaminase
MQVPLLDLKAQHRRIRAEIRQAIDQVLESQQFILGSAVQRFEAQVASYLQSGAAIGVASGSDALLLALMALGIKAGDAVLVPPFTFFSTVSSITRLGATPIFVDIDTHTCLIDPNAVEVVLVEQCCPDRDGQGLIDPRSKCQIKAILPVHLFGQTCPMAPLVSLARKHRLRLIEDVAQAFGARATLSKGSSRAAGTVGDFGCFSFFPTKTLGGMGDGGLVVTAQSELADTVRMLRVHGAKSKYHHETVGLNSRLDALQAAVLSVKLRYIDKWCEGRIERAQIYDKLFAATALVGKEIIGLPPLGDARSHVFNHYVIRVRQRNDLKRYLEDHGIQSEVYYPVPLHLQPCFASLGHRKGDFPNSELVASQVLALPMYPELTPEQQETIVQKIEDFYRK